MSKHKKKKKNQNEQHEINSAKPRDDMHHIIPSSRGGTSKDNNLVLVNWDLHHNCYHKLFGNMTPEEICVYLTKNWWNGDVTHMRSALAEM